MHRFRKKSETGRSSQVPPSASSDSDEQGNSPHIPLPNDFRTSLILPDLSRRFSLLRSSSGEPVALDILRSRLADQRARGAANHISEEEEEMIFDTLRNFRSKPAGPAQLSGDNLSSAETDDFRQSSSTMQSSLAPSSTASVTSSPNSRSAKRYSNNLFGSGRFHDYNYMRSVTKNGNRAQSLTPTESSVRANTLSAVDSLRPVTPESSGFSSSTQSSPIANENAFSLRSASLAAPAPYGEQVVSVAEYSISKSLGPSVLKRASMAIEEVIKEFEEEAEDEILMPRSTPIPRGNAETTLPPDPVRSSALSQSSIFEAVMAISSDKQVQNDPEVIDRRASPVPSRILPGYVPGMPRPMTPRDFDIEDQRSHSTTPRATSPMAPSFVDTSVTSIPTTGRLRSNSSASQSGSRSPTSPLFLQRSPNSGRYTPEDNSRVEFDNPLNSSLLARRRPASPLAGPPYQSMAVSSRPSTPSNVVWRPSHSRNGSSISDSGMSNADVRGAHERYTSGPRPMRSPPLPDSPIEGGSFNMGSLGAYSHDHSNTASENGPSSVMTLAEFGSPRRPPPRSATPTQSAARSPTSPTFQDRTTSPGNKTYSQQNAPYNSIPPLVLSPLFNSSHSSLESAGSSYHTWDGGEKDHSLALFNDPDVLQPVWHDLSSSSSATPGDSPDDNWNPEEVVARIAGLKKSDFIVIQEKLLSARDAKEKDKYEPLDRAGSSLRKRRPSTSQSHYSVNGREPRVGSPPPQVQIQTSPSKVTVPNIKGEGPPSALDTNAPPPASPHDLSPTTRRNRDLAQALFGREETDGGKPLKSESTAQTTSSDQPLKPLTTNLDTHSSSSTLSPSFSAPYQVSRNLSVPKIPQTPQEEAQLTREVQERINAATEFLKPSNRGHSPDPNATISRKRISPNQISTPRLVSASTSVVDTVPILKAPSVLSANSSGPSKIGSRFKKLRGTLRAKNPLPNNDEAASYTVDPQSPSGAQMANYDPARLRVPGPPVIASATETRYKVPVPSPPASAGPGLKGFMARFRGKQRPAVDTSAESERRKSPQDLLQPSPQPISPSPLLPSSSERTFSQPLFSPLGRKQVPASRPETPQAQSAPSTQATHGDSTPTEPTESSDMIALRQFYEAANRIGIDQGELNALLARSGSTSSKADWTALTRSNSAVRPGASAPADPSRLTPSIGRPSIDNQSTRAMTPDPKTLERGTGRTSIDGQPPRDKPVSRQVSRKHADQTRRPREGKGDHNAVVRKTIIIPDKVMTFEELKLEMEKSMPGRRASITSTSSRSIHDRAPTPPPPRSPTHKRLSHGPYPPVPSLPAAFGNSLNVPSTAAGGALEKSNSTYDSLYDMYAGESRSPSATPNESGPSRLQDDSALEAGAAVELIQLANGQTIWNIVNGLREDDDDDMSVYTRRTSFASEYNPRGANGDGGLQLFVREHGRSSSKGSTSSFLSRKRPQGKSRPETTVYQTPAEGIGRLIQELSQNMESGSFNIVPRPGHSASSSLSTNDLTWTLEERLDEMIDTVRAK